MQSELLEKIERHLVVTGVAATRFGRTVVGDPRFVEDLRAGRMPRERTVARIRNYLDRPES
jgi:hypothetical protein